MDHATGSSSAANAIPKDGITTRAMVLNIAIVGGGIGGLSAAYALGKAGHRITVFEAAPVLEEVGAGIQLTPNMTRILYQWGIGSQLEGLAVKPTALTFRRWEDGKPICRLPLGETVINRYGAPYYHIHRADLQRLLYDSAAPYMTLRLNSRVRSVDPKRITITLESGEIVGADLILGADGLKSVVRKFVSDSSPDPTPTGDAAYRAIVSGEEMLKVPELRHLVEERETTGWIGPRCHIVGYLLSKNRYNVVMVHPDDLSEDPSTFRPCRDKLRTEFSGWEPRVQKLLSLANVVSNWRLLDSPPLDTWVHPDGKLALLGDACHPMLPYRAQGSAMAVEDAAVLGHLFDRILNVREVPYLLRAYEKIRRARATAIQTAAKSMRQIFHMDDGPRQQARDESMRAAMARSLEESKTIRSNTNPWTDDVENTVIFSYDTTVDVDHWWRREGTRSTVKL